MWVLNTEYFGQVLKPQVYGSLAEAADSFMYYKLHTLGMCVCVCVHLKLKWSLNTHNSSLES